MTASLVDLLLAAAARAPDKVALRRQLGAWSYGDLTRGAAAAAAALREAGLEPGDRVGLLFRNSPEYVAFFYGALAARLAVVPLNVQERASVLALQVAHSGARLVVGDPDHPEWTALSTALPERVSDAGSAVSRRRGFRGGLHFRVGRQPSPQPSASDRGPRRHGHAALHLGHHRSTQGRDAEPRQPGGQQRHDPGLPQARCPRTSGSR